MICILPPLVSINCLQFTPSNSITTTDYVTWLIIVVNKIFEPFLHIELRCFSLQNSQVLVLGHSEALCFDLAQKKQSFFSGRFYIHSAYVVPSRNKCSCWSFVLSHLYGIYYPVSGFFHLQLFLVFSQSISWELILAHRTSNLANCHLTTLSLL